MVTRDNGGSTPARGPGDAGTAPSSLMGIGGRGRLIALGLAILGVLWLARGIVGPFVVAAVLAYAFSPVVSAAQVRTGLPRALVIAIGYVIVLGALAALALVAANRIDSELRELSAGGNDVIASALHKLFGNTRAWRAVFSSRSDKATSGSGRKATVSVTIGVSARIVWLN